MEKFITDGNYSEPGYYYEHINGSIIWKSLWVVDMGGGPQVYFDSPFVKRWWRVSKSEK